ncbi:hypothetical protein CF134_08725 [Aeromonas salmonicida]|uniref:Uncharacterized protein n=2 Tax=Aeromonas salmonicida TaxID=645 RepID=A0A2D1QHG4_AERSA|nr:hypothetical protein [Aeromonas salmonicida]ATP09696.1 uncharacterized protein Asalp_25530 [Aeromonas salmonicida subsp. pectinolytica 34mel]TNI17860.1 hypothetical protein CF134_08725 [Aeromonas salmonicida]
MRRDEKFKKFDLRTRNQIRSILSDDNESVMHRLKKLSAKFNHSQLESLDEILNSSVLTRAVKPQVPFPKKPPFFDTFQIYLNTGLDEILTVIDISAQKNIERLRRISLSLGRIDEQYAAKNIDACVDLILLALKEDGWSHALLRRIILIRENKIQNSIDERIEELVLQSGIKGIVVSSLIHSYARDQNILMSKRSVLNISDRGAINRYTRTLAKLTVQPYASSNQDLGEYLGEVLKCSLIDAIILAKFNSHYFTMCDYPAILEISNGIGNADLFESLVGTYDSISSEGEYTFFKQSSVWLEYEPVRMYRVLIDHYYDSSREYVADLPNELEKILRGWVGVPTLHDLVSGSQFTSHSYPILARLEISGNVTRSALFNFWLTESEGAIGFEKEDLFTLMGLTRDLARTIPIPSVRTAAKLSKDKLVKLILLLLLAKRSKNERDIFLLRKLLEDITYTHHGNSLVELVKSYEVSHPYIAEYIYDIATEDFLARLTNIAPHLADIPEIRASLHEWMASFTKDEYFLQRARAVRIDHQINRVRNEIDDHRIYVDPMRFTSWIEDEMMIELNSALTSTGSGKKGVSVTCDEAVLSIVMAQSYTAFCSNAVFGIASYIGRRIRHGTFHGHMYSHVINHLEQSGKFNSLFSNSQFIAKWSIWKENYNNAVEEIIAERLHVFSKSKPLGLLTPETYTPYKQEVLSAAVSNISKNFSETTSTADICPVIIDYCWRLAEVDLVAVIRFLKAQQTSLKNEKFIEDELIPIASLVDHRLADMFRRELALSIDRKLSTMLGWFKRPSIVAPKASVALLFAATVAEIKDTIPDFDPQDADTSKEDIELVGNFYHLIYDALAIVVGNAAKYADRSRPVKRNFEILYEKEKRLIIDIRSSIKPTDDSSVVSEQIEMHKRASFQDANLYDKKSGISKLLLLASNRKDFELDQYEVVDNEVRVRLSYVLEY